MAQALFDDHPIEHYLRESGEVPELMPGGSDDFLRETTRGGVPYNHPILRIWLPRMLSKTQRILESVGLRRPSVASKFAERFKYVVISSSLLSSSLSPSVNRAPTPTTPGHYDQASASASATISTTTLTLSGTTSQFLTFSLACLVPAVMSRGYYLSGLLILAAVKVFVDGDFESLTSLGSSQEDETWTMTLENLEALVEANNAWESVVSETVGVLETEEQSALHPSTSFSLSVPLRIALSSSLHTTQTQCDNVRQLLAALTSPLLLSQLSHMYAPPSPSRFSTSPKRARPMSLSASSPSPVFSRPGSYARPPSLSVPPDDAYTRARAAAAARTPLTDKRSTWNGSYMSLAGGPSPRRSRRRPNLTSIIRLEDFKSPKTNTFPDPGGAFLTRTPPLTPTVPEDIAGDADVEDEPFGVTALDMHHKRRSTHVLMFNTPSPPSGTALLPSSDLPSRFSGSIGSPMTSSFGSRFTPLAASSSARQTHSLSLSNLHAALQGALGSKRFVCSHLLALRFSDPSTSPKVGLGSDVGSDTEYDDEPYWEDVRSVISLLTSTLEDASSRLAEALADTVRRQDREQELLTDEESSADSASVSTSPERVEPGRSSTIALPSFAPVPSHLTRFAAHVSAITSTLDDAREHLHRCVASLRGDTEDTAEDADMPAALQSYERLRRELGLALRECERGRGILLEIVKGHKADHFAEEETHKELPVRQEHFSSGESDKTLYNVDEAHELEDLQDQAHSHDPVPDEDDATSYLVMTAASQHLPPPGVEQVFEAVSATQPFVRERSKLTREERIRLVKAQREGQFAALDAVPDMHEGELRSVQKSRGLGGEVVQELKDVIWKVSEQRRRMVERSSSLGPYPDTPHVPP